MADGKVPEYSTWALSIYQGHMIGGKVPEYITRFEYMYCGPLCQVRRCQSKVQASYVYILGPMSGGKVQ